MESTQSTQYKLMIETPIPKLITKLAIPTIISMLITNIYNMADTYFVSGINMSASGAISVVFALMAIIQAFGFMYGQGAGSRISRMLGQKKTEEATKYASESVVLSILTGVILCILGMLFLEPLMYLLGSTDTILPYAKDYSFYILISAPALAVSCVLNNILRYEGKALFAMIGLTSGGILNMILDPIFIYTLGMEAKGAGLSTAVSQYISVIILFSMFLFGKTQSKIRIYRGILNPKIAFDIITTGLPSLARQGLSSTSTMIINNQARILAGDAAIAAMGIVNKVIFLMFSIVVGIGQGFQPVSGFNYGAKKYSRVKEGCKFILIAGTIVLLILSIICAIIAPNIIKLFREETEIVEIGTAALRISCITLFSLPMSMCGNMLFQSLGKKARAFLLACCQNGLILIPVAAILPNFLGIVGLEMAQPISYVVSASISMPLVIAFLRRLPEDGE